MAVKANRVSRMRLDAREMLARMGAGVYREAYESGTNLSVWLDRNMPRHNDGMDGFQRLLFEANIATRSDTDAGVYADEWDDFNATPEARALIPEWIAREWRSVQLGRRYTSQRALYTSDDAALGTIENAYRESGTERWDQQLAPAIPVSELVALTTPIQGDAYKAWYLVSDTDEQRMARVAEGAEIPRYKLVSGEKVINLYKYGAALEATYEQLRRQRIDRIAMHIQRMAVQAEVDKVSAILDVIVSGDGNSNTAAEVHDLTDLDTGTTANNLTLAAWLAFKMEFENPYMLTHVIAQTGPTLDLMLLNIGSANVPLLALQSEFGGFTTINPGLRDGVRIGWTSDAPASKIVGFDARFAIERVVEIGAAIQEIERFISRQVELITMTEVEGYAVFDADAAHILNLAA
ncbi:MAG: hypothetical protein H6637_05425 [Ardenticatenales bacterium]|nr:hypothetical protein [Ardenticatenales bacterium]